MRNPFKRKTRAEKLLSEIEFLFYVLERLQFRGREMQAQLVANHKEQDDVLKYIEKLKKELEELQ